MNQQVKLLHVKMEYKKLLGIIMTLLVETNTFPNHTIKKGKRKSLMKKNRKKHAFIENP